MANDVHHGTQLDERPLPPRLAYNLLATRYDSWHWQRFWRENEAPLISAWLPRVSNPMAALDAGCGTGFYAERLAGLGYKTTGLDVSENMLAIAKSRVTLETSLVQGDITALPFR